MTRVEADEIVLTSEQAMTIELLVWEKIGRYINSYQSSERLSQRWIKTKGNDIFWWYTGETFSTIGIKYTAEPIVWNSFEIVATPQFRACSDQGGRHFLPGGNKSFDKAGNPTEAYIEFMENFVLEAMDEIQVMGVK